MLVLKLHHLAFKAKKTTMPKHGIPLAEITKRLRLDHGHLFTAMQQGQISSVKRRGRTVTSSGAVKEYLRRKLIDSTHNP